MTHVNLFFFGGPFKLPDFIVVGDLLLLVIGSLKRGFLMLAFSLTADCSNKFEKPGQELSF